MYECRYVYVCGCGVVGAGRENSRRYMHIHRRDRKIYIHTYIPSATGGRIVVLYIEGGVVGGVV
jgi:hypothetical protein